MKYYTIRKGKKTGVFKSRNEVKTLVTGFPDAKYKSFTSIIEAEQAFASSREKYYSQPSISLRSKRLNDKNFIPPFEPFFIAVDAACSGNPGILEYKGVEISTGHQLFHHKFNLGTNNIGEFLAIVEGLAVIANSPHSGKANKSKITGLYSDSLTAISRIKDKKCRSTLRSSHPDLPIRTVVDKAEEWLYSHEIETPIYKWHTSERGEIPADFGRK